MDDPGSASGDPGLQENLVKMVRLQIGQEKVKESVEEEKQKLQKMADEVCNPRLLLLGSYCRMHHHIIGTSPVVDTASNAVLPICIICPVRCRPKRRWTSCSS